MHNPKFSIITVTYNAGKTLEKTIQSIISQSYRNVEYIIVDGKSKDNTLQIADTYKQGIHCIVSEPDKGLYDAMNKGIRLATGDYLCFLNAGDKFHDNDTLQRMVDSLKDGELPDVLYGKTAIVDENGNFLHMRKRFPTQELNWKSFKQGMVVCHQAFFASRKLAPAYDLKYRFSADVDWCIRVMKKSKDIVNTHVVIVDYLQNGLSLQNHRASLIERFRIMAHHYGLLPTLLRHAWFVVRAIIKK